MPLGALSVARRTLLALCSVGGARGAAAPYARAEPPLTMLPVHLAAGASSACGVCGKNDAGTANCCSEGGAWHGSCGDGAEHTWQAGFNACNGAAVQEAAADQTAAGPEPTAGGGPRDASLSCSACGTNGAGESNCCSSGGAWQGKCGNGAEHTWQAGFDACNGAPQEAARDQEAAVDGGARADTGNIACKENSDCHDHKLPHCVVQVRVRVRVRVRVGVGVRVRVRVRVRV